MYIVCVDKKQTAAAWECGLEKKRTRSDRTVVTQLALAEATAVTAPSGECWTTSSLFPTDNSTETSRPTWYIVHTDSIATECLLVCSCIRSGVIDHFQLYF